MPGLWDMNSQKTGTLVTLLNESAISIRLNESRDYKRITLAVYSLTSLALFSSGLHWLAASGLTFLLLWQYKKVFTLGKPLPDIDSLILKQEAWLLCRNSGDSLEYEKAESLLDNDFFQLIKLSDPFQKSRTILLFHDQLQPEMLYCLRRRLRVVVVSGDLDNGV